MSFLSLQIKIFELVKLQLFQSRPLDIHNLKKKNKKKNNNLLCEFVLFTIQQTSVTLLDILKSLLYAFVLLNI